MSCRSSFFVELYRKNGDPDTYLVSHRALHFSPRHLVFPSLTPARFFICSIMKSMGIRLVLSCASVRLVVIVVKFVFSLTNLSNHIFRWRTGRLDRNWAPSIVRDAGPDHGGSPARRSMLAGSAVQPHLRRSESRPSGDRDGGFVRRAGRFRSSPSTMGEERVGGG